MPSVFLQHYEKSQLTMKKLVATIWLASLCLLFCDLSAENNLYMTKKNYPMAHNIRDLELFNNSIVNNQTAIFLKLRQEDRAWMSKGGIEVHVVETVDGNKVKIRPTNSNTEIWTVIEAVKKK